MKYLIISMIIFGGLLICGPLGVLIFQGPPFNHGYPVLWQASLYIGGYSCLLGISCIWIWHYMGKNLGE